MPLLDTRLRLTPSEYPFAEDYFHKVLATHWTHTEVSMAPDKMAWQNLPERDKEAIAGLLQGFTMLEAHVACYWSDVVAKHCGAPEIVAMARQFSAQETVHAYAYNHLEASLGLDTYEAFLQNSEAQAKLKHFAPHSVMDEWDGSSLDICKLIDALAFFSGCGEGVSLFASFAILLSYDKAGAGLLGLSQILSWSTRDENMHSDAAAELFKIASQEYDYKPEQYKVANWFELTVQNELAFIAPAFAKGDLPGISYAEAEAFTKARANDRIVLLGYKPIYEEAEIKLSANVAEWFYPKVQGTTLHDFFSRKHNGSAYSAKAGTGLASTDITGLF